MSIIIFYKEMNPFRLAILQTHPIQYHAPFFRKLAECTEIDVTVFYCSDHALRPAIDPGFGVRFTWDRDLVSGYVCHFLKNYSFKSDVNSFFGLVNLGIVHEILVGTYDALLIHGYTHATTLIAYVAARIKGVPIFFRGETIITPHSGVRAYVQKLFFKFFFSGCSACFPVGKKSRAFYDYYKIPESKLYFMPYAVDNEYFFTQRKALPKKSDLKKRLGYPDLPIVLFAAKLINRKRPHDVLQAFSCLPKKSAVLVFVGDGPLRSELESYAKKNSIDGVFFEGFKNQGELSLYFGAADIFVLPSGFETFGLVVNEAMCFGLPIITSDAVGCATDLVQDGSGYIYPVGDVVRLGEYISLLLNNPHEREQMGKRSSEIIVEWSYGTGVSAVLNALAATRKSASHIPRKRTASRR